MQQLYFGDQFMISSDGMEKDRSAARVFLRRAVGEGENSPPPRPKFYFFSDFVLLTHDAHGGHKVAPLYIFCESFATVKVTYFKPSLASDQYLGHVGAKFDGRSFLGDVTVTSTKLHRFPKSRVF